MRVRPPAPSRFEGPSGTVTQGDTAYEVTNGKVCLNGKEIGEINDSGDYTVKLAGREIKGNVGD